ncbi:PP2C family protein-serine/threonine phosphatase [Vallitalea okinawensis]|uniref:PP2C family protein-serine/threonine phosphatase n=1 Tax=Vallitalea okinawensis TaxID=2078660 RepID=UPI000CFDCA89|nr:protein phosphatase 2C domain-containing protein [Vallitalea okinawensis]
MLYNINALAISHIGLKRQMQEDNFLLSNGKYITLEDQVLFRERKQEKFIKRCSNPSKKALFAVSDGMGGHNAGEIASTFVIQALRRERHKILDSKSFEDAISHYQSYVEITNSDLCQYAAKDPTLHGMGATLATLMIYDDKVIGFNIGDSRIYHYCGQDLRQMSKDHTEGQRLFDLKLLNQEELKNFGARKALSRYFGMTEQFMQLNSEVTEIITVDTKAWFLLCSDGLTDVLTNGEIETILHEYYHQGNIEEAARKLTKSALAGSGYKQGGMDNITIILIEMTKEAKGSWLQ